MRGGVNQKTEIAMEISEESGNEYGDFQIEDGVLVKYLGNDTNVVIPDGVIGIANNAFNNCVELTNVIFPCSLEFIENDSFYGCSSITSIDIPENVIRIDREAFRGCDNLINLNVTQDNSEFASYDGCLYSKNFQEFRSCPEGKTTVNVSEDSIRIGDGAFSQCKNLRNIEIPEGVTELGYGVFKYCSNLTDVALPNSLISTYGESFYGCSSLTKITIPENLTTLYHSEFWGCIRLETIDVSQRNSKYASYDGCLYSKDLQNLLECPGGKNIMELSEKTVNIQDEAFPEYSKNLIGIVVPEKNSQYSSYDGCLYSKDLYELLYCPRGKVTMSMSEKTVDIEEGAFSFYGNLNEIDVQQGNSNYASFKGCLYNADFSKLLFCPVERNVVELSEKTININIDNVKFKQINVPEGNDKYASYKGCLYNKDFTEFLYCGSGVEDVEVLNKVKIIGDNAFKNCISSDIILPEGVVEIGEGAFRWSRLKSIVLPESLKIIGDNAFGYCIGLNSIEIPKNVSYIGDMAFMHCNFLNSIAFSEDMRSKELYIGRWAFAYINIVNMEIPNSIEFITFDKSSFCTGGSSHTVSIIIPDSVVDIQGIKEDVVLGNSIGTIYGKEGSCAQTFAEEKGISFSAEPYPDSIVKALSACQIIIMPEIVTYDGSAKMPSVVIKDGDTTLQEGIDYRIEYYKDNICAGEAKVVLTGLVNYAGSVLNTFTILEPSQPSMKAFSTCKIMLSNSSYIYDGTAKIPSVTVKFGSAILKSDIDYTIKYMDNIEAGTAKIILTGKGEYTGSLVKTYTIQKAVPIITCKKLYKKAYGDQPFSLDVKANIKEGHFVYKTSDGNIASVSNQGNVKIEGTGIVVITVIMKGTSNYKQKTESVTLKVSPAKPKLKDMKLIKNSRLKLSWKKDKQATGYQICYSVNKSFRKNNKTVMIGKSKTTSKIIKKLEIGKRYYVKLRSYKIINVNGKTEKLYGKWSNKKRSEKIK